MLKEIPYISVREKRAKEIVKELTCRDVPVVIDPSLMLDVKDWDSISKKPSFVKDNNFSDYLVSYFLGIKSKEQEKVESEIAKKYKLKNINLQEVSYEQYYTLDPAEFIWLIKNASFICTDSFHGTLLSIMYQKKFWSFNREEIGYENDNRLSTILGKLDLEDCICKGQEYKYPDYNRAFKVLETERSKFKDYIANSLQL